MSVATHLNISLDEYDSKIRSFIPRYEAMIATAASVLRLLSAPSPLIVDLGIGTGALADACLAERPDGRLYGVDEDAGMLDLARARLAQRPNTAALVHGSFVDMPLPACDAVVASLALHHVRTPEEKGMLYAECRRALRPGGLLISADCFPAGDPALAVAQRAEWRAHLEERYSRAEADAFLQAWAKEDVYFPLVDELEMMRQAQLIPDVVWRAGSFAVISARR